MRSGLIRGTASVGRVRPVPVSDRGRRWPGIPPRLVRDPFLWYTALLAPVALFTALADGRLDDVPLVLLTTPPFLGVQAFLGMVPSARRPLPDLAWSFLRLSVAFAFVAVLVTGVGGSSRPLAALYLPVVVAASAIGLTQGIVLGVVGTIIYLAPLLGEAPSPAEVAARAVALAGVGLLLAAGTRQLMRQLQGAAMGLRSAIVTERRRSRQIAAMEAVSRLMVSAGGDDILSRALRVVAERFGYRYVSVYLWDGARLRIGAQENYPSTPLTIEPGVGIVGRVAQTHELAFWPDVSEAPGYVAVYEGVVSEICAPLLVDGAFLGILNVESATRLDRTDRDLVVTIADRLATVVALGRDRQALAERAALFSNLHEFTSTVSLNLDPRALCEAIVEWTDRTVPADEIVVATLDRETGRYQVQARKGGTLVVGRQVRPGEGPLGRTIRDRVTVVDDGEAEPRRVTASVPLIRDAVVVGAVSVARIGESATFRPNELETLELLAGHASLGLANAFLHADVEALAILDPLTGLYNRRYFDEALDRMLAFRRRANFRVDTPPKPLAVIMFDLDHFGVFNKQHGHQVGDRVLRLFADVLRRRFRSSDLVARFGGEEFIVVMDGAAREDAVRLAEQVRGNLAKLTVPDEQGHPLHVTVSAGCAALEETEPTRENLLRTADVALFMAKRSGRDRVVAA
jgi:diguanylate cyclase (GGDEF)-like protein